MSLTAAMLIGRSGLTASQAGVQVAANNIANAATPGYSRQLMTLEPARGQQFGSRGTIGRGVQVTDIRRQVSESLQARLWVGRSDEALASSQLDAMGALEAALQELSGNDLSSELSSFFGTWSEAANMEQSSTVVVQRGQRLAEFMQRVRRDVSRVRGQIEGQLGGLTTRANELLEQIAQTNKAIAGTERGKPNANELRDQRDMLVTSLSELVDVSIVEQTDGQYDVIVGGTPVVLGGNNLGLQIREDSDGSRLTSAVALGTNGQPLNITSGVIGGLLTSRDMGVEETLGTLDDLASRLVFEVNRLHSTGRGSRGLTDTSGTLTIPTEDRTRALNSSLNDTLAGLPYGADNGGFYVNVRHTESGLTETVRIDVDLDGLTDAGLEGFDDDTSAEDIRAALDGVDNLTATFSADGRLRISAASGYDFSFSDDTSGALAVLGVNSFFQGSSASDIGVVQPLLDDPSRLATGRVVDGSFIENATALEIADLQSRGLDSLSGATLQEHWGSRVQQIAVDTEFALDRLDSASIVRESLEAQRAATSGVSIDEESINLINYQKQYEGSARIISIARELLDTLLATV